MEYMVPCPTTLAGPAPPGQPLEMDGSKQFQLPTPDRPGEYRISVMLMYRKVDQFLLNFAFGEDSGLTAPVTEIARAEATVRVRESRIGQSGAPAEPTTLPAGDTP